MVTEPALVLKKAGPDEVFRVKMWEPSKAMVDATAAAGAEIVEGGNYVMGEQVRKFEDGFKRLVGGHEVTGVSSGSDALYLALRYYREIEEVRTVHVPAFTFIATVEPAVRLGMNVVLHDVDLATACMESYAADVDVQEGDIWLPVQLYGYPVSLPDVETLVTIVDAAQGHGIWPDWDLANAVCYSFYPTKNLGAAGQAGAVVGHAGLGEWAKRARAHGEGGERFVHDFFSGNYRMDEIQGFILNEQLAAFNGARAIRQAIGKAYIELLRLYGIVDVIIPQEPHEQHVYHIFGVRVKVKGKTRDDLAAYLKGQGIQTAVRYPVPIHKQPAAKALLAEGKKTLGTFRGAEQWASEGLTLPMHEKLTDDQVEIVVREIARWVRS